MWALPELSRLAAAGVVLPEGRPVRGEEGKGEEPVMWISDGPATGEEWAALRAAHGESGLWPLLLDHLHGDRARPWNAGELWPAAMSDPGAWNADTLLAGWWSDHAGAERWPGPAASPPPGDDPDVHAAECVDVMLAVRPKLRLGLVATARSADSVTAAGWQGPANHENDTAKLSAVLRSWEDRFAARVIGVGFDELYLSVAAPPADHANALAVAAEHLAFCPDSVSVPGLAGYAGKLVHAPIWSFWWD